MGKTSPIETEKLVTVDKPSKIRNKSAKKKKSKKSKSHKNRHKRSPSKSRSRSPTTKSSPRSSISKDRSLSKERHSINKTKKSTNRKHEQSQQPVSSSSVQQPQRTSSVHQQKQNKKHIRARHYEEEEDILSDRSPPARYRRSKSRSKSRSPTHNDNYSDRSSRRSSRGRSSDFDRDRSASRDSVSRHHGIVGGGGYKNQLRRSTSSMNNMYQQMPNNTANLMNMNRRWPHQQMNQRGGRNMKMGGGQFMNHQQMMNSMSMNLKNKQQNNKYKLNNMNSMGMNRQQQQSLLGGYRPMMNKQQNYRNNQMFYSMNNANNMANMIQNMNQLMNQQQQQQQQQQQNGGAGMVRYQNPNNPNNRFYQQFQDNYKKIINGEKVSNLYQASFPVQHIPREMRFNFRLLGRNIFTASDEEEEAAASEKKTKSKKERVSDDENPKEESEDERKKRREEEEEAQQAAVAAGKKTPMIVASASSPVLNTTKKHHKKHQMKHSKSQHQQQTISPPVVPPDFMLDPNLDMNLMLNLMNAENNNILMNQMNPKCERIKKQEKKVQKFKNYARFQQTHSVGSTATNPSNPEEVEKKIHGLARRLQMKTIGLQEDYELLGIKRSSSSSSKSHSSDSDTDASKKSKENGEDKELYSDISSNSEKRRERKLKKLKKKKTNVGGSPLSSSDKERSDNDSDGSMLNLNEELKSIGYYVKDRERMLSEMFRCVRGTKLQAMLPEVLKNRLLDEIKAKCLDQLDIMSKKRIRAILHAQQMSSSSGTEDSTDEEDKDVYTLYPHLRTSINPALESPIDKMIPPVGTPVSSDVEKKPYTTTSKFRPIQMRAINSNTETNIKDEPEEHMSTNVRNSSSTPVNNLSTEMAVECIRGEEDINDYYEGFKKIKKLANLRRMEKDEGILDVTAFEPSGKFLNPHGKQPKFEFKPITGLGQQQHLTKKLLSQKENDISRELDDMMTNEGFTLPGQRPASVAELKQQQRILLPHLPPRQYTKVVQPPKKGSLGDLLKQKKDKNRSPSPADRKSRQSRSSSTSSIGSRGSSVHSNLSFGSYLSGVDETDKLSVYSGNYSYCSSCNGSPHHDNQKRSSNDIDKSTVNNYENTTTTTTTTEAHIEDFSDITDLSQILDLNEEDELLLLQLEVEQEERNTRKEEKRRKKEEKKLKKKNKIEKKKSVQIQLNSASELITTQSSSNTSIDVDIEQTMNDLLVDVLALEDGCQQDNNDNQNFDSLCRLKEESLDDLNFDDETSYSDRLLEHTVTEVNDSHPNINVISAVKEEEFNNSDEHDADNNNIHGIKRPIEFDKDDQNTEEEDRKKKNRLD
ncbi:unnamed protein product [Didymodactylos carnosus]|uniref:Uncharacterized protein n=1 Tax=Didymodactylos carnosus TaxID=1234261 RepID=A0A8S2H8S5_9BILA|nr:unnamed protein product [Didymodactylos carnosus]CAF3614863.1 unnamed protein product [Didymodactylos carnosus]